MSPVLIGLVLAVAVVIFLLVNAIRILPEYERGVVFRLGRLRPRNYGPGFFLLIPIVDKMVRISLSFREQSSNWPSRSRLSVIFFTSDSIRFGVGSDNVLEALSTASASISTPASRLCGFGPG